MCMIAYAPAGAGTLTPSVIGTAMGRHADGFGIAWRDTSGSAPVLRTRTFAPHDKPAFRALLDAVMKAGDEYAVHFRMATSGPKSADMSHPFTYEDPDPAVGTVAVLHNGIISIAHDRSKESDTAAFVRLVLAQLPTQWWTQPALVYLVREAIGYSKLTIMTAAHGTHIVGEEKGEWDGGIWYSSEHRPSKWTSGATGWKSTYTPKADGGTGSKPANTPPTPGSKRSQKRAAKQALREARRKGLSVLPAGNVPAERALVTVTGTAGDTCEVSAVPTFTGLRHAGHNVSMLASMPLDIDADYQGAVICDECRTSGDVYVIDGSRYIDLAHFGPGDGVAVETFGTASVWEH